MVYRGFWPHRAVRLVSTRSIGQTLSLQAVINLVNEYLHSGLDPALPMFIATDSNTRLHQTDAVYVDIIHTCAGTLGIKTHIGHADFYPNGGSEQSGCCDGEDNQTLRAKCKKMFILNASIFAVLCSHSRAPLYYFESVRQPDGFKAVLCDSWNHFMNGNCDSNPYDFMGDASDIRWVSFPLKCVFRFYRSNGYLLSKYCRSRGSFYLRTSNFTPYSLGIENEKT